MITFFQIRVVNAFRANLDSHHRTMNIVSPAVLNSLLTPVAVGNNSDNPDETGKE